jgi:hypothetical protein
MHDLDLEAIDRGHAEISSYLPTAVVEAVAFVEKHSIHGFSVDAPRRTERILAYSRSA